MTAPGPGLTSSRRTAWRASKSASVTWLARWRDPEGRQRKRTFPRKADAGRFLTTVEHSVLTGSYVDPGRSRVTVGGPFSGSTARCSSRPAPAPGTRACCAGRSFHAGGACRLPGCRHADSAAWVAALSASGLSPRTVHKVASGPVARTRRSLRPAPAVGLTSWSSSARPVAGGCCGTTTGGGARSTLRPSVSAWRGSCDTSCVTRRRAWR